MSAHYGYAGKILKIDLSGKTISEYLWNNTDRRQTLGGKILAAQILSDHLTGTETALSEENWVVIATGPLTGTGAPGCVRFDIAALSPKDNLPAFSNCGGDFGLWLKKAGYDALILSGRSQNPCWLEITESQIFFHNAADLWGTGTEECQETLKAFLKTKQFGKLCIGPAGENLVPFASVVGDGHSAGRAGIGAVLGWKNLKAVTVSGNRELSLYAPEAAADWNRQWHAQLQNVATEPGGSVCPGCPLHCRKSLHTEEDLLLNDLGLDAIAARDAAAQAEQDIPLSQIYRDIACHRYPTESLPKGKKGKGGKRRGGSFGAIRKAFHLSPDDPQTDLFCRRLTEAVSAAGQCVFTLNAVTEELPTLNMLKLVTGMELDLKAFLQIGSRFETLESQIREKLQ